MEASTILILGTMTLGSWVVIRLVGPFATALAQRFVKSGHMTDQAADVSALQDELEGLHERLDSIEQVLTRLSYGVDASRRLGAPPSVVDEGDRVATPV